MIVPRHPDYMPPCPGEVHCYRRLDLRFPTPTEITWVKREFRPSRDPDGSIDYGNIWELNLAEDGRDHVCGDWGAVQVKSDPPSLADPSQPR